MTTVVSAAESTAQEVAVPVVDGAADAVEPDSRAAAVGSQAGRADSPAAVRHQQFRTADPQAARRFFASVYAPAWRVNGLAGRSAITHRRCEAGALTLDEVMVHGRVTLDIPAGESVIAIQPRAGSLSVVGGPLATVDFPILVASGVSCALELNGARFDVVSVAAKTLHKVAADRDPPASVEPRFLNWRPRSGAAVRTWQRALDYVTLALASPDTAQQPLMVAAMAPLLAAALLECFPSNVTEQGVASEPAVPETLKDAVSFIHRHAAEDVGINDVAAAVHLTPRAVQYLFRRQLGTTPTEYMRRVRLNRAHQDLVAGAPSTTTVTQIAQRWGFAHTGRFAVLYRQTYGQSPHTTLRHTTSQ